MSRRFNEDEVRTILNRAIQHQEAIRPTAPEAGLTLEEIQRIAADVGVDPQLVVMAAQGVDVPPAPKPKSTLWGGPIQHQVDRTIPGTLSQDLIAEIVSEIRLESGTDRGHIENIGSTFEWMPTPGNMTMRHVKIQERDGQLHLHVREKFSNYVGMTHMWAAFPLVFGMLIMLLKQDLTKGPILLGIGMLMFLIAFVAYSSIAKNRTKKLEALTDRIEKIALRHHDAAALATPAAPIASPNLASTPAPTPAQAAPRPQLDLDKILDAPPDTTAPTRRGGHLDAYGSLD